MYWKKSKKVPSTHHAMDAMWSKSCWSHSKLELENPIAQDLGIHHKLA